MYEAIIKKQTSLAVIGMGYVGLPIALEFAKKVNVVGFDINPTRIKELKSKIDPSGEILPEEFENKNILFTDSTKEMEESGFYIVAVPTPIDTHNVPDLRALKSATTTVSQVLKPGDYVVFESTVYPGCTEEECLPILEKESGLKAGIDFKIGYSPERINPGDKEHTLAKIKKVVSGCDQEALNTIAAVYEIVVEAGIFKASSIKLAEAAKVIENTQRDLNIALMNELSMIFDKLKINTYEVLEAAATKWNFLKFTPGLVGGHCIGVDPYYLTYKSQELGYNPKVILSGRNINDGMGAYVGKRTVQMLINSGVNILSSRVLIMGATFKENVKDIRNSKVVDLINEILSFGIKVDIVDPLACPSEFKQEYGLELLKEPEGPYEGIVLAVPHEQFKNLDSNYFSKLSSHKTVFIDIKGVFKRQLENTNYWTL